MFNKANTEDYMKQLLKAGFTDRFAKAYIDAFINESDSGFFSKDLVNDAWQCGITPIRYAIYKYSKYFNDNPDLYLKDFDYDRLWPQNDWLRIWVNDKLTLKYILNGTEFGSVMPDYYYYTSKGGLRKLVDNPYDEQTIDGFLSLLKEKQAFACKPCNGSCSEGFFKLSYTDTFMINNLKCSSEEIEQFIANHQNYIFTEFLRPEESFACISPTVPTIRVIVINENGNKPYIVPSSYIRFGTVSSGTANYIAHKGKNDFTIFAAVDTRTGNYSDAAAFYNDRVESITYHPDTNVKIEGTVPNWDEALRKVKGISKLLFGVEWLGFDLCIDDKGACRLMEINTLPGLGYNQFFSPFFKDEYVKGYFTRKIMEIESLDSDSKERRSKTVR